MFLCLSSLDGFPHLQVTGKGLEKVSEFRTGCDSFLRQRDASEPRRFNRSHVSVTGIKSSAGEHEPDVIDTPVNHTFPVHSHRLLAEALIVFYKANAPSHHTNLHF